MSHYDYEDCELIESLKNMTVDDFIHLSQQLQVDLQYYLQKPNGE